MQSVYPVSQPPTSINQSFSYEEIDIATEESAPCMPVECAKSQGQAPPVRVVVAPQEHFYPAYSTVGVPSNNIQPVAQPDASEIRKYQLNVKFWCRFCLCMGYIWAVAGALQIFGNGLYIIFMDAFPTKFLYQDQWIQMNGGCLFLLAIFKIVVAGFGFVQGKTTVKLFQSILKEYGRAERGEIDGIRMERKSNEMKAHKSQIKKIIVGTLGLGIFAMIITQQLVCDVSNQIIEVQYSNKINAQPAVVPVTKPVHQKEAKPSKRPHHEKPQKEIKPEPKEIKVVDIMPADHPFNKPPTDIDTDFDLDKMVEEAEADINKEIKALEDAQDNEDIRFDDEEEFDDEDFHWTQMAQLWKKHGDHHRVMKKAKIHMKKSMKDMTQEEAKALASRVAGGVIFVVFALSALVYLFWQGLYICFISKCQQPQEKLEKHFMGPETSAIPDSQSAIRTINVQHNHSQPQYVYMQQPIQYQAPQAAQTGRVNQVANSLQ